MNYKKWKYLSDHWKLGIHLILHTKHFGVNNRWWENFDSFFAIPLWKIIYNILAVYPLVKNYKAMKYRAIYLGFMHPDEVRLLWEKHPWLDK